jgi:hypothetical protein
MVVLLSSNYLNFFMDDGIIFYILFYNWFLPCKNRALNFPRHRLALLRKCCCTSRCSLTKLFRKTDNNLFEHFVLPIVTACTSCSHRSYFPGSLLVLLADEWAFYLFLCTFGFCRFSCTPYIKWMYCFSRMVVLISFKYLKFLVNDKIIWFFLTFGFLLAFLYFLY